MLNAQDIRNLARFLVDRYDLAALHYVDQAIRDLDDVGDLLRAQSWRTLRCVLADMVTEPSRAGAMMH
jgi:hypothetical protein